MQVLELTFHATHAYLIAQSATKPGHFDRYQLTGGQVSGPTPWRFTKADAHQRSKALFTLADIDFTVVPRIRRDALDALPFEDAEVSSIALSRFLPSEREVRWRVNVRGNEQSGSVDYSLQGARGQISAD
ncbi:MAG: hypothetical protein AAF658_22075 [Myxococcota bacterium]